MHAQFENVKAIEIHKRAIFFYDLKPDLNKIIILLTIAQSLMQRYLGIYFPP